MKKQVSILVNTDVYNEAKALGLNVSKITENTLRNYIEAIKNIHGGKVAGPMGFEPMTFSLEGWQGTAEDWQRFRDYLKDKKYSRTWESTLYNYAQSYSSCLFSGDLAKIQDLPASKRPNVLKALSALAKFTGQHQAWLSQIKNYGFSWVAKSNSDIFIDRMSKTTDSEEVWRWIKTSKEAVPGLAVLFDLMAVTGLRFGEAVNSINLVVSLAKSKALDGYYKDEALEHWRFKDTFIRNSKKAFVSFVPKELVQRISESDSLPSANAIQLQIERHKIPRRFGDIREAHATYLTKFLKTAEIDFLHGRVTSSVFMANYFNPSLICDLKERVFLAVEEIEEKIK